MRFACDFLIPQVALRVGVGFFCILKKRRKGEKDVSYKNRPEDIAYILHRQAIEAVV